MGGRYSDGNRNGRADSGFDHHPAVYEQEKTGSRKQWETRNADDLQAGRTNESLHQNHRDNVSFTWKSHESFKTTRCFRHWLIDWLSALFGLTW